MHNDEAQWENDGGQVKPEPVDEAELGGEGCNMFGCCSVDCTNPSCEGACDFCISCAD